MGPVKYPSRDGLRTVLFAAVAALLTCPSSAEACSCIQPRPQAWPSSGAAAPLNTRVLVYLPTAGGESEKVALQELGPAAGPAHKAPKSVAVARRQFASGAVVWVELTPKAHLAPKTTYRILAPGTRRHGNVAGEFTTGSTVDSTPPAWKGKPTVAHTKDRAVGGMCSTGQPYLQVEAGVSADPNGGLVAVWMATGRAKPDVRKPPLVLLHVNQLGIGRLGPSSICSPSDLTLPKGTGPISIALAPLDLAGNMATPQTIVVTRAVSPK